MIHKLRFDLTARVLVLASAMLAAAVPLSVSAQDAKLPQMTTIKALTVPYFAPEFIAKELDFYKKYNLDVEFVNQVAQGAAGIPAIVSNQVQTGQGFGGGPILQARAGGAKVTAVVSGITSTYGDFRLYVRSDSGISSAKDLKGKGVSVNVLLPGGAADTRLLPGSGSDRRGADGNLLSPALMRAPIVWLMGQAGADVSGHRFVARLWPEGQTGDQAAALARSPAHELPAIM